MQKSIRIKEFITNRIKQIDENYQKQEDILAKLKLSTQRTSFANILNVYLNDQQQLGISYYKHALTYQTSGCFDQAIYYAQLAKKNIRNKDMIEDIMILYLNCLIKIHKADQANDILNQFKPMNKKRQYYELKAQVMQKLKKQEETYECLSKLQQLIQQNFTKKSEQMGLYYIQKGKKKGTFKKYEQALQSMHKGINILIQIRYKNHIKIGEVYLLMSYYCKQLQDYQSQYTNLICAHSMVRQSLNKQKQLIDIMHKITQNLIKRQQYQNSLKQIYKIQSLQKYIYGQSSLTVAKTIKKISEILLKLNKKYQSKKYQLQYNRIISCNDRKSYNKQKPLKFIENKLQ